MNDPLEGIHELTGHDGRVWKVADRPTVGQARTPSQRRWITRARCSGLNPVRLDSAGIVARRRS